MPLMKAIKTSLAFNLIERKPGYSPEWFTDRRKLRVVTRMDTPKSGRHLHSKYMIGVIR